MLKVEDKFVLEQRLRDLGFDTRELQSLQAKVDGKLRTLTAVTDPAHDADGQLHFFATWQDEFAEPTRIFWHELTKSTQAKVLVITTMYQY